MPDEDLIELKFRLYDGSDIGPFRYSPTSTIAMVKERILAEWPKGQGVLFYSSGFSICELLHGHYTRHFILVSCTYITSCSLLIEPCCVCRQLTY